MKNRLQVSYEYDGNIRENPASDTVGQIKDSSARFLFQSQASRNSPKTRLGLIFRSGLQIYAEHAIENKLINEVELTSGAKVWKVVVGGRGSGRLKLYLNDLLDYASGTAELYVQTPFFSNITSELAFQVAGIDYQNFTIFDYSENQFKWQFSRKLTPGLSSAFEFGFRQIRYNRTLNFDPANPEFGLKQEDDNYKFFLQLNYSKKFLLNLSYAFQHNTSNTVGYGYNRHQVILVFGTPLFSGIWLRGYGAYQSKRYSDKGIPMFPVDIDTERDESNFFIADLSKDLKPGLTAMARLAFYNNESIIRSRFYRKLLLTAGFDFRF
ncbi:MAG TPA: hypothetical protein VGA99_01965 [bacterium]